MNKFYTTTILFFFGYTMFAQSADVTEGCSPLRVQFNTAALTQYYWDFADGGISTDQNPEYFFSSPGVYTVKLKEGINGAEVGQIRINVYDKPDLDVSFDVSDGCAPLDVNFTSKIILSPNISITNYKWTFGDGNFSEEINPSHTYQTPGLYTVSFEVTSSLRGCSVTEIFFDVIDVAGVEADFNIVSGNECNFPFQYGFVNLSPQVAGNTYFWDFGNGQTSTLYNPGTFDYNEEGEFEITLRVTSNRGCVTLVSKNIRIGLTRFILNIPDSICIRDTVILDNMSTGSFFQWQLPENILSSASTQRTPPVCYESPGFKSISLKIGNNIECQRDTTFMIYVQDPSAGFTFDPLVSCLNPMEINLIADSIMYKEYYWHFSEENSGPHNTVIVTAPPRRDSFHMNFIDTVYFRLEVVSHLGCVSEFVDTAYHHRPDAYFLSSEPRGCAPLKVDFNETSLTHVPIVYRKWIWGDGSETEAPGSSEISHVFTDPGEYFVKLIIENEDGCRDTSVGMWIYVGEPIIPEFALDKTEICIGEAIHVNFLNNDTRIDNFHLSSDDGRFQHCWTKKSATHIFDTEPGLFDVKAEVVYNGCYSEINFENHILVKGAKANIGFKIDCEDPLNVDFMSKSLNADNLKWFVENTEYTSEQFKHRFSTTGDFSVRLEAGNTASGCPVTEHVQLVRTRKIKAVLEGDDKLCKGAFYEFSAAESVDVDSECSKGYLWKFSHSRPRETNLPNHFEVEFPLGRQWIELIVEDTNGCRDTVRKNLDVYDVYPDMEISDTDICFPATVEFLNLSTADTTIASWKWFNEDEEWNTTQVFEDFFNSGFFVLEIEDVVGCKKRVSKRITGYKPISNVILTPGNTICRGNQLNLTASDYTLKGSSLDFHWDIGGIFTSDIRTPSFIFEETGTYPIVMIYTEKGSGCMDTVFTNVTVIESPIANFTSDVESFPFICHPRIINFKNESEVEGEVNYMWNFRENAVSILENPSEGFPKGEHVVTLIVSSIHGCADTLMRNYVLVGPEGEIKLDTSPICTNQEILLDLIDTADIYSYQWLIGDGNSYLNEAPLTLSFNLDPSVTSIPVRLVLSSGENECELVIEDKISFFAVEAAFEIKDTVSCQGQVFLDNLSIGVSDYYWDFGDGTTSIEENPVHTYSLLGEKFITLIVSANDGVCRDTIIYSTLLEEDSYELKFPNVFTPNGDGQNDIFRLNIDEELKEYVEFLDFRIVNRWGDIVYNNENAVGWDGNYKGQPAPAEIYAYYIVARIKGCDVVSKKGNVTLIR